MKSSKKALFLFLGSALAFAIGSMSLTAAEGSQYYRSQLRGYSMHPTIKSGEFIVYKDVSVNELKEGDIIVYKDLRTGERVCHRVIAVNDGMVKAKGDNNRFRDRGFISNQNLLGLVTQINGKPA